MHAWFRAHSELVTHSGLQVGGLPMYPTAHEQTAWPLISLHWLFGPQGDGLHGFLGIGSKNLPLILLISVGNVNHTFSYFARYESVSAISQRTTAHWDVINNSAFSVYCASAWTRIYTFTPNACFIFRAIIVQNAFWSATVVWIAMVFG